MGHRPQPYYLSLLSCHRKLHFGNSFNFIFTSTAHVLPSSSTLPPKTPLSRNVEKHKRRTNIFLSNKMLWTCKKEKLEAQDKTMPITWKEKSEWRWWSAKCGRRDNRIRHEYLYPINQSLRMPKQFINSISPFWHLSCFSWQFTMCLTQCFLLQKYREFRQWFLSWETSLPFNGERIRELIINRKYDKGAIVRLNLTRVALESMR